ncbi:alpha/beta-hydrolase [Gymnopus androsaceus JB14]|uniref:Alpha/beta-hydrolase n=1 Tax=Gymnopus androsaceus JB14 TaxID=1447944 RepID=A0A6A4GRD2_9AGAR|nr:alpha/beta-hydrolase [Gymnopus androsaceus JB14]
MLLASNQYIIVVLANYRTNVFGFPGAPDLPLTENNLGFLDQELALQGSESSYSNGITSREKARKAKQRVFSKGESGGAKSVSEFVSRHPVNPPFRAAILFSGATLNLAPNLNAFNSFNNFSTAVGCTEPPGPERLACLRAVWAEDIRVYTNGPTSGTFGVLLDNVTAFDDNLDRILLGNTARVPQLVGNMHNDGTLFTVGQSNLTVSPSFWTRASSGKILSPDTILVFLCLASLWAQAFVQSGISSVFRYEYVAVFPDLQLFPNAGAFHSSELQEVFGTYNVSTAIPNEVTLSRTFQTTIANVIKNPNQSPAPNWPKYVPGGLTRTLARLAYNGNVDMGNFVQAETSNSQDAPCTLFSV